MSGTEARLAVVIGGGNGIGAATTRLMAQRGWRVAVVELTSEHGREVAQETGCSVYAADISDLAALERAATDIEREHGPVSALVVSAAMFQDRFAPADFPIDLYRRVIDVNLTGTFYANRVFGTRMAQRGYGSIVNIASDAQYGGPQHAYGPAKAGVITLTKNLAAQWGRSGVRVNSVSPGMTLTKRLLARPPGRYAGDVGEHFARGRPLEPTEIAEATEFLASDRASGITGADLLVDAGLAASARWGFYGGVPPAVAPE